jgi:hypothetical protein
MRFRSRSRSFSRGRRSVGRFRYSRGLCSRGRVRHVSRKTPFRSRGGILR